MNNQDLRARFEALAYQRYLDLTLLAGSEGDTVEVLPKEAVCARNPDGTYFVLSMNSAWWGYQAGAGADPAAVQVVVPPLDGAPGGESAVIFPDISELDRAGAAVALTRLPAYGSLPWSTVRAYVEAAVGAPPIIDPEYSIGHQIVGINFNSLNRIMSALVAPTTRAGYCDRSEGCVCGGDTKGVREGCSNWVKGGV